MKCRIGVSIFLAIALAQATQAQNVQIHDIRFPALPKREWNGLWAGGLIRIECTGLNLEEPYFKPVGYPLPYDVWGISVKVGVGAGAGLDPPSPGLGAPILEIFEADGKQTIIAQVPWEYVRYIEYRPSFAVIPAPQGVMVTQGESTDTKENRELISRSSTFRWNVFLTDSEGYVLAQHSRDLTWVTARNPARPGETILLRAANLGPSRPAPPTGYPTPSVHSSFASEGISPFDAPVRALDFPDGTTTMTWTCGGRPCQFAGQIRLLQGEVSIWTIPIKVPDSLPPEIPYKIAVSYRLCPYGTSFFQSCVQENFTSSGEYPIRVVAGDQ